MRAEAVTWKSEKHRLKDIRRRKIAEIKYSVYMFLHKVFWRILHITRLARPYSIFTCFTNMYRRFPDGRCHWCGKNHYKRI